MAPAGLAGLSRGAGNPRSTLAVLSQGSAGQPEMTDHIFLLFLESAPPIFPGQCDACERRRQEIVGKPETHSSSSATQPPNDRSLNGQPPTGQQTEGRHSSVPKLKTALTFPQDNVTRVTTLIENWYRSMKLGPTRKRTPTPRAGSTPPSAAPQHRWTSHRRDRCTPQSRPAASAGWCGSSR